MAATDIGIAVAVLAAAAWLLYRSLWKAGGHCHGCSGGACRPRQRDAAELVRIGQLRRPSADRRVQLTEPSARGE